MFSVRMALSFLKKKYLDVFSRTVMSYCLGYIYRHQFILFFLISVSSHVEKCTVGFKVLHSLHDRPQYTTRLILRDTVRFGSSPALDA